MSELKGYVDNMFRKYGKSKQVNELRDEILGNLEAKKADLIRQGLDDKTATEQVKISIVSVDNLIEGNKLVAINKFKIECLQWTLIYLIVVWIVTIPLGIFNIGFPISFFLFALIGTVGIWYVFASHNKREGYTNKERFVNYLAFEKVKNLVWAIWVLFVFLSILSTTAVYFSSNIWFSRPIRIDGPYALGLIIIRYSIPFITIIIPLIVNKSFKLINKYEAGEKNED